jgi:spore coat polysaccharide biosynthesis protein SpsF (cytidylyltransferase family)
MNILAIIQARLGSTRLPRKVLLPLGDKTILEHVVARVRQSARISDLVVATPIGKEDLAIVKLCAGIGVSVYCGSEDDVLDRFYQAARLLKADHIVRITADCPLIDPQVLDAVIELHLQEAADYTTNTLKETFPDGLDVEVLTWNTLKTAWEHAGLASEREHVTPYIKNHPERFRLRNLECQQDLGAKRWTVDNAEDYEFITIIYRHLARRQGIFGMADVLEFLSRNQNLESISHHLKRNEGYAKSLREDRKMAANPYRGKKPEGESS